MNILVGHNKYDHTKSSYYKKDGQPFIVEDEGYNLTGFYSYDTLYVCNNQYNNCEFEKNKDNLMVPGFPYQCN